ncbi:hypothetical protein [Plantactinospora sp. CA-290183]|uniref:hypothetical protein n=1 Tax=Plantactinospora sp. CA-290183 TaxID=3240006 RepID=UPI003D8F34C4
MSGEYDAFDVTQLWQMVDAARRDLPSSREQISAWWRAHGMLDQHVRALRSCRDQLAALWPPESNAASAAYLTELDRLVTAAEQTSKAAQTNATHIGYVADAIEQAHRKLKPIYEEYVKNEGKLAEYQSQLDTAGAVGAGVGQHYAGSLGNRLGGALGKGALDLFTSPPVEDGRQAELSRQARAAMTELGGAARDGNNRVETPPEYRPPATREEGPVRQIDDDSDRAIRPPVIDPPPHRRDDADARSDRPGYIEGSPPPGGPTMVLTPEGDEPPAGAEDRGPVLTTVNPPVPPPPGPPVPPGPPGGGPPPPGTGPGIGNGPLGIMGPPPITPSGVPTGPAGAPARFPGGQPPGGPGGIPPGGVIGGRPATGPGAPMPGVGGGAAGRAASRVNPVGGVIGPPGAAGGGVPGARAPRGRSGEDDADQRRWDPDNPWEVEEGVAPAIEPSRGTSRHEPGGGVIGKDR